MPQSLRKRKWQPGMICGIKGTSLIDYPGKVAAVLYTNRCNFRCPFCHNRDLALGSSTQIPEEVVMEKLALRRGFIDGVVITGGEPTIHSELGALTAAIKQMGFAVKLDTNGYNPNVLREIISAGTIDFIAMDIKTSLQKYSRAAGIEVDTSRITKSINLIKEAGVDCEFRTTCVPGLVDSGDIEEISKIVGSGNNLTLQQFQPENTLDPDYNKIAPYTQGELTLFWETAKCNALSCRLIGI